MVQKIIKVGNSAAVIIPKEFLRQTDLKPGDQITMETDSRLQTIVLKTIDSPYKTKITPEFKNWLDKFMAKNDSMLKKLANTP